MKASASANVGKADSAPHAEYREPSSLVTRAVHAIAIAFFSFSLSYSSILAVKRFAVKGYFEIYAIYFSSGPRRGRPPAWMTEGRA
jgi:hypothetical protein